MRILIVIKVTKNTYTYQYKIGVEEESRAKVEDAYPSEANEMFGFDSFEDSCTYSPMEEIILCSQFKEPKHSFSMDESPCCSSYDGIEYGHSSIDYDYPHEVEIKFFAANKKSINNDGNTCFLERNNFLIVKSFQNVSQRC